METPLKYPVSFILWVVAVALLPLSAVPVVALFIMYCIFKGIFMINDNLVAGRFYRDLSKRNPSCSTGYKDPREVLPTTLEFVHNEIIERWKQQNCGAKMVSRIVLLVISKDDIRISFLARPLHFAALLHGYEQWTYHCSVQLSRALHRVIAGEAGEASLTPITLGCFPNGTEMFVFINEHS